MCLSSKCLYGISIAGIAGISYLIMKYRSSSINECEQENVTEDSENDMDEYFFDAETGSYQILTTENANLKHSKSIEKLYKDDDKRAFRKLQNNFEELKLRSLREKCNMIDAIQSIEHTVKMQELTIESLQLDIRGVINNLNVLIKSVNVLNNQMTSTERHSEKPLDKHYSCKLGSLKTRISMLEREVTKNSSEIIGTQNTFREILLTRINSSSAPAAVMLSKENPPNTYCYQSTMPTSSAFTVARSPLVHSATKPPPPPPSVTSDFELPAHSAPRPMPTVPSVPGFGPPPPPPMMMTSGTPAIRNEHGEKTGSSKMEGTDKKAPPTYHRMEITEDLLKSVVLKPPGQRMSGKRI